MKIAVCARILGTSIGMALLNFPEGTPDKCAPEKQKTKKGFIPVK